MNVSGPDTNTFHAPPCAVDEMATVRQAAAGDKRAFEWIMRRYNPRLYRLARAALNDDANAKDALQDAYLAAYRALAHFRAESSLSTWLARIVLNECAARWRRVRRRQNVVQWISMESNPEIVNRVPDGGEQPDDSLARAQMRGILARKVSALPDSLRVVFVMRSVEEMSVAETAQCLGLSEETVRVRHFRARRLLRGQLARLIESVKPDIYEFGGCDCDDLVANVLRRVDDPPVA